MSFDFDRAWRDAARLFADNRPALLGLAGVFFFLPDVAVLVALPHLGELPSAETPFPVALKMLTALYVRYWWIFAALLASLIFGTLAMLALMKLRARPTVGETLAIAARSLPSYLAALMLSLIAIDVAFLIIGQLIAATGLTALSVTVSVAALFLRFYLYARLSMTGPAVVLEGLRNPLGALRRSWQMTQGSGSRLLGFFALVMVAFIIASLVATLILGLVIALLGEAAANLANAVVSGAIMGIAFTLFACLLAASYSQLVRRREAA